MSTFGLLAIAVALVIVGARFMMDRLNYVKESDARIVADVTLISSRIAGRITEFPVSEGQLVGKGQALALIDARAAKLKLAETTAQMNAIAAERDRIAAEIDVVSIRTERKVAAEKAKIEAARALIKTYKLESDYAADEYARVKKIWDKGVIARDRMDKARNSSLRAERAYIAALSKVHTAEAELEAARAEGEHVEVLKRERARLSHKIAEHEAQMEYQLIDIQDRDVKSPIAGVVTRTFVTEGEFVSPGQRIALVHDPDDIWVEALVKETDIRKLKLGQRAVVSVDAYPDQRFEGKIVRIGHAATSQFSLLPNPNPSGNFTKITQRLPVKVALPQQNGMLKPGMMVEVSVDVRER
jgi:membrane fusion protein (multidrug efflux system)